MFTWVQFKCFLLPLFPLTFSCIECLIICPFFLYYLCFMTGYCDFYEYKRCRMALCVLFEHLFFDVHNYLIMMRHSKRIIVIHLSFFSWRHNRYCYTDWYCNWRQPQNDSTGIYIVKKTRMCLNFSIVYSAHHMQISKRPLLFLVSIVSQKQAQKILIRLLWRVRLTFNVCVP